MSKKAPRIYNPEDLFQREVKRILEEQGKQEPVNGRFFADVDLTTTPTKVSHGLGRIPKGWYIADINAATTVYRDTTASERNRYLTLIAGADCTVSLWIF